MVRNKIKIQLGKLVPNRVKVKKKIQMHNQYRDILLRLQQTKGTKRLIILLTPCYGNIGDHAIVLAQRQFLRKYFPQYEMVEVRDENYKYNKKIIHQSITAEDVLLIDGGGFLGTLWKWGELQVREIISIYCQNKIIIFPQTIFFSDDEAGKKEQEISKQIYKKHMNLYICVREKNSYELIRNNFMLASLDKCLLTPDIAMFYQAKNGENQCRDGILICLRKDREQYITMEEQLMIEKVCHNHYTKVDFTDTVAPSFIKEQERQKAVNSKISQFSSYSLLITDRLHGMILALLAETPCLFLDNCSHKISGVYEAWLKDIEYIKPITDLETLEQLIVKMKDLKDCHFNAELFEEYLQPLVETIQR